MKIDFHSHVKISKKSEFMPAYFQEMMKEAKMAGLNALCMTEHFNTRRFFDIYDFLDKNYPYENGYYNIEGFKLFPGIEVDVKEVGHILLIGDRADILSIRRLLDSHTKEENFVSFNQLMDWTDSYNLLKIGAHAFRESTPLYHLSEAQLLRLDALDLNGKDLYSQGVEDYKGKLVAFARKIGLPYVGGSDTHQFLQYGCILNEMEKECNTVEDLKATIGSGSYQVTISKDLPLKVKSATITKKWMKKALKVEKQLV